MYLSDTIKGVLCSVYRVHKLWVENVHNNWSWTSSDSESINDQFINGSLVVLDELLL